MEESSHAWNVIYPCDGSEPVLVDVTWDDGQSVDTVGQTDVDYSYFTFRFPLNMNMWRTKTWQASSDISTRQHAVDEAPASMLRSLIKQTPISKAYEETQKSTA